MIWGLRSLVKWRKGADGSGSVWTNRDDRGVGRGDESTRSAGMGMLTREKQNGPDPDIGTSQHHSMCEAYTLRS